MDYGQPPSFEDIERPLPRSEEAEKVLLGAIIMDNALVDKLIGRLVPDEFSNLFHNHLFTCYISMRNKSVSITPILIIEEMKQLSVPEGFQNISRIANLISGLPHFTSQQIEEYIVTIKDKALSRDLIRKFNLLAIEIQSEEKKGHEYLEQAQTQIFSLGVNQERKGFKTVNDITAASLERAQTVTQSGNPIIGLPSGFVDIDKSTLGWQRQDLIIIAARPSMGKTALALTLSLNAAIRQGAHVAVFSLEMGDLSIGDRLICSEAEVDSMKFRNGTLNAAEWEKVHAARSRIAHSNMVIDDTPGIAIQEMNYKLRNEVAERGQLDLIVVDYLQLMSGDQSKRSESRQQEVSQISRELKQVARVQNAPTIALSQLSRAPEQRGKNHRPVLSDLRESGAIEQDADVVAFIYRHGVYADRSLVEEDDSAAEFIISKQRNGPTLTIDLYFDKKTTKFSNGTLSMPEAGGDF